MMTLYRAIDFVFWLLNVAILLRVLFSWINPDPYNPFVRVVYRISEPILNPLRRHIPPFGGIDITPIVAVIILELVRSILLTLLF